MDFESLKKIPHSLEAERALIGGIFYNQELFEEIKDIVTFEDFYKVEHSAIYEAMEKVYSDSKGIDAILIDEEIKKSNKSVTEKSEEIVKAYEDYLYNYGDNKKAFEEYAKARDEMKKKMESDGQEFKWEPREDGSPIQKEAYKIETKLANELSKSEVNMGETLQSMGNDVIEVAKKDSPAVTAIGLTVGSVSIVGIPAAPLVGTAPYQKQFYDLVQTGQPLDLKTRSYNDSNSYSLWARNWGGKYHDDYAGNYLYGYVGQGYLPVGTGSVRTAYLKQAAGVAQGISDRDFWKYWGNLSNGNWGDNPGDAQTIQDGADAYENREK